MDRRTVMKLGAFGALLTAIPGAIPGADAMTTGSGRSFVSDDIGPLRKVLINSPSLDDYMIDRLSDGLLPWFGRDIEASVREHAALVELLQASGADILQLQDVLQSAIDSARERGAFKAWLSGTHPRLYPEADRVSAATLLGRDPAFQFRRHDDGTYRHTTPAIASSIWTRDPSFMTPEGLVIGGASTVFRARENLLLRFVMKFAPEMAEIPVVFDGDMEGFLIEGGDAQLLDEKTLLLGVGQQSDARTAAALARRLNLDVVAVRIHDEEFIKRERSYSWGPLGGLRMLVLHLDTFFTHVNRQHALTVPWLLEQEHAGQDPLSHYLRGARIDTEVDPGIVGAALKFLEGFGRVQVHAAGTGKPVEMDDMKLVDYVREKGYRITWVGGQAPEDSDSGFRHFMRHTLRELRNQAANVVATAPGQIIAYAGNPLTQGALERDGIRVGSFASTELVRGNGGPHCLTMPIARA
ncbi:MAG: arginine deiminase family protein [Wenzhouxiangella sp.]